MSSFAGSRTRQTLFFLALTAFGAGCGMFAPEAEENSSDDAEPTVKSYLFMSSYDSTTLLSQRLLAYEVDRETGTLTFATSVNDLSNAQNPVVLNGYLYIHSRGENKIRCFRVDPASGALTETTTDSGTAVLGIYAGSEFAVDTVNNRLAIAYAAGSSGGIKKVRFLQQDPETGVLTQMGTGTDSSAGTSGVPDALAYSHDYSQLMISHNSTSLGIGAVDGTAGTYTTAGVRGLQVGAMLAYPGTNFFLVSDAQNNRIETYTLPLATGSTSTQLLNTAYAYFMVKHPSLDVIYAAGSVMGTTAYSFNKTTGALTLLNQAGGATVVADAYADDGLAVLSNGKFAYASHYDYNDATNTRLDIYPLDTTTGAFGEGSTEVDLTALQLPATSYPRFLTLVDFEAE